MANNPLHMSFCGLEFASPIVLLSGCVGFGEEYTRVEGYSNADVGAVCLKGTTGQMRLGNPPHRVYETPDGMLNAIGLQNPGADRVVNEILPELDFEMTKDKWRYKSATELLQVIGIERPTNGHCRECGSVLRSHFGPPVKIQGIRKWKVPLREHDTTDLDISIMSQIAAMRPGAESADSMTGTFPSSNDARNAALAMTSLLVTITTRAPSPRERLSNSVQKQRTSSRRHR